jgi:hypothetical protein
MSAYIKFATPMIDQDCLLAALLEVGFGRAQIEVHNAPVNLVGYEGAGRSQKAEIVIRRQHVGPASNDIGFHLTPTGYTAIISDFDRQQYGPEWIKGLCASYQEHEKRKIARLMEEARQAAEEAARVKAELERRRMEEERRRLVESQRQAVTLKARKLGYQVQERREGDVLRLVLVKRTF